MKNNNTCVLALVMFYETKQDNSTKYFRVLSCVVYTIIENYVSIYLPACQLKTLSVIYMDRNYLRKIFSKIFGIGIPYLIMNLLSYHGFVKNINSTVVLLCPSQMLE